MHNHACGHDHAAVTVSAHEGALVGAFEKKSTMPPGEIEKLMRDQLQELSADLASGGALIGHIKAAIKSANETVVLSITKNEVSARRMVCQSNSGVSIGFAAIVFNSDEEAFEERLGDIYQKIK
jgi:hypothetical protein